MIGSKIALWKSILFLIALSIAAFAPFLYMGIATDCKPGQNDGQCGLSTFVGFINGAGAAAAILFCGGIYLVILQIKKRNAARTLRETNPH
ncbi:hypothetical protein [Granulicella arctica]|uniref:Uncharacterized protein n=1 Tax=Granulicella arctica TaxID=940613 RepID=A0A7Y9PLK8_9BACT|nr:hypothetical protein [Granulicella arctica]NYF81351.1 hypothetical protein [Granulicella arctica]